MLACFSVGCSPETEKGGNASCVNRQLQGGVLLFQGEMP